MCEAFIGEISNERIIDLPFHGLGPGAPCRAVAKAAVVEAKTVVVMIFEADVGPRFFAKRTSEAACAEHEEVWKGHGFIGLRRAGETFVDGGFALGDVVVVGTLIIQFFELFFDLVPNTRAALVWNSHRTTDSFVTGPMLSLALGGAISNALALGASLQVTVVNVLSRENFRTQIFRIARVSGFEVPTSTRSIALLRIKTQSPQHRCHLLQLRPQHQAEQSEGSSVEGSGTLPEPRAPLFLI